MNEHDLESAVVNALERMMEKYQRIDGLADEMLNQDLSADRLDEKTVEMKRQRESIERLENETRSIKDEYRATRQHATPEVQKLTEQLATVMQGFLMKIGGLEKKARGTYESLQPQIHSGVRAVQMKNAYGKYA